MNQVNPWDRARKLKVIRGNHFYEPELIDRGVNFFVLMLERLGCTPIWSCEGHPTGFYIVFNGPHRTARLIAACGFFDVELVSSGYKLSLKRLEWHAASRSRQWTNREKNKLLRLVAEEWVDRLGSFDVTTIDRDYEFSDPRSRLAVATDELIQAVNHLLDGDCGEEDLEALGALETAIADAEFAVACDRTRRRRRK
jgi:hypothetical protein